MFQPLQEAPGSGTADRALRRGGPGDAAGGRRPLGLRGAGPGSWLGNAEWGPGPLRDVVGGGAAGSKECAERRMRGMGRGEKRKVIKKKKKLLSYNQ